MLDLDSDNQIKHQERALSRVSMYSNSSGSVYSRDGAKDQLSGLDIDTQDPAMDALWLHLAESTTLSNSGDVDESDSEPVSWHTALSNQSAEDKSIPCSAKTDIMADEDMPASSPPATSMNNVPTSTHSTSPSVDTTVLRFLTPLPPRIRDRRSPISLSAFPDLSNLTVYKIASTSTSQALTNCLLGSKIAIVNGTTSETYLSDVPLQMLLYFCGPAVIEKLLPGYDAPQDKLEIPNSEAECNSIARVIRFMRRCCLPPSHAPSGDMRIPQGAIEDGIETIRACRVFGLHHDADRIERIMVRDWLNGYVSDDRIDLIWNGYFTGLRESCFGDAVVWFVLKEMQDNANEMTEELLWMLEQKESRSLKERIQNENQMRLWRQETRDDFLDRWGKERRRAARQKARFEKMEEERIARVDAVRMKHREEAARRVAERGLQITTDLSISLSKGATGVSTEPRANSSSVRPLKTNTPSGTEPVSGMEPDVSSKDCLEPLTKSTLQLYTGSDVSLEEPSGKYSISSASVTINNRSGPSITWDDARAVRVPKKKVSLWKRLKTALDED
jgi:hypothetical protein